MLINPDILDKYHSLFAGKGEKEINENEFCLSGNDNGVDYIQRSTVKIDSFLIKYYGQGEGQYIKEPLHTVPTKDRFGLVNIKGQIIEL